MSCFLSFIFGVFYWFLIALGDFKSAIHSFSALKTFSAYLV